MERYPKRCPFCRERPTVTTGHTEDGKKRWSVKCRCGAMTRFQDRRYKALEIWNRRDVRDEDKEKKAAL